MDPHAGGRPAIDVVEGESPALTVEFEDQEPQTFFGYRPGIGTGAVHFDVHKTGGGTIEDASVTFTGGGRNPILTISEARCVAEVTDRPDLGVRTDPAIDVNEGGATLQGFLLDTGNFEEVAVSFEWRQIDEDEWQTIPGDPPTLSDPGPFSAQLEELATDTEYEFRAVAEADGVRVVGLTLMFEKTEPGEPDVETKLATDVNESTATLQGFLTDLAGFPAVSVFFEWRQVGAEEWQTTEPETLTARGPFSATISGLEIGVAYEFQAVAVVPETEIRALGGLVVFDKREEKPEVKTKKATDVNKSTATLNANLLDTGGFPSVDVFFQYRAKGVEEWSATEPETLTEPGPFSATISGLERGVAYEYRALAQANDLVHIGQTRQFVKRDRPTKKHEKEERTKNDRKKEERHDDETRDEKGGKNDSRSHCRC